MKEHESTHSNPHTAVKYCPDCKGDLTIVHSEQVYCYKCSKCELMFEIKRVDESDKKVKPKPAGPVRADMPDATL